MSIDQQFFEHQNQQEQIQDDQEENLSEVVYFQNIGPGSKIPPIARQIVQKGERIDKQTLKSDIKVILHLNSLNDDPDFLDDTLKSAFFYKPYEINNLNLKYETTLCREAICANRRVRVPVVKVGEETINQPGKSIRINVESSQFTLKIQSQPYTNIIFTTKPNSHPLLQNQLPLPYQKKFCSNHFVQSMPAPCEVNILAVSQSKIESKLITVKVTTNQNIADYSAQNIGYAVRPMDSFPFEDSSILHYQSVSGQNREMEDQDFDD